MKLFDAIEPAGPPMRKGALISDCGRYRYILRRQWDPGAGHLLVVMLNPSTADAEIDDPTIKRCISFARREMFGGIVVMNLFAFRATSPNDMKAADDPIGPDNDSWLGTMLTAAPTFDQTVLAAWGAHGAHLDRAAQVVALADRAGCRLVCLGTTAAGHPRHPLYVAGHQPLVPFEVQS